MNTTAIQEPTKESYEAQYTALRAENAKLRREHTILLTAMKAIIQVTNGSQPKDYPGAGMVAQNALNQIKS